MKGSAYVGDDVAVRVRVLHLEVSYAESSQSTYCHVIPPNESSTDKYLSKCSKIKFHTKILRKLTPSI